MCMSTMDDFKQIARTSKTPDEAEKRIIQKYGELPDELLDPLNLAAVRAEVHGAGKGSEATGATLIDAHLSNFEQAYEGRLSNPKAIGYERNVAGQGQPGTKAWVEAQKETKPQQPAKEIPPTTKG